MNTQQIIFIVGPTAMGKSEVAVSLAQRIGGEIVSCDSMQIYKEVSIASSKPSTEMRRAVRHHLIDVISVRDAFNVAAFRQLALGAIEAIWGRGHIPIVVGGSGMYVQVLLDGIFEAGPKDEGLRQILKKQAREEGVGALHVQLEKEDPLAAANIHPHDERRIIRALEVCRSEGHPISQLRKSREGLWGQCLIRAFALNADRPDLYRRINERVDRMFAEGLVEEIKALASVPLGLTAESIIGVGELRGCFSGLYDEGRAREMIKQNTRRFAKRQLTWFRKEKRLEWIEVKKDDTVNNIVEKILEKMEEHEG